MCKAVMNFAICFFILLNITFLEIYRVSGNTSKCEGIQLQNVTNITIGYLTVDKTAVYTRGKQGRLISGAISYALELINNDSSILPNHTLQLIWGDTMANTLVSTRLLTAQWREGALAFIGLEDRCSVEAKVAAAWNLPMISYKCTDYDVSNKTEFPTFARTFPPATQVATPIISLLLHYNWKRFTLIFGEDHMFKVTAAKIRELAYKNNITINAQETFKEPHIPLTTGNPFPGIVERTFVDTRVYVFLGTINGIVDIMTNLYDRGLLDTGEYVVIYFDHETVDTIDNFKYYRRTSDPPQTETNKEAVRSLIVITGSPPSNPNYEEFKEIVRTYIERDPFNFPNPFKPSPIQVTVYAAYLFDAVKLYAHAAHQVLLDGGELTNGTAIIQKILDSDYTSIQGYTSHIDENGDAEGNYTLLSRQPFPAKSGDNAMMPVGHFEMNQNKNGLPIFRLLPGKEIYWVSDEPPIDEPKCGYRSQKCKQPKIYSLEIFGGVTGGVALLATIIGLFIYRNWHYEQEIAGLLWRINREDLKTSDTNNDRRDSFSSRMTLSQLSVDCKMSFTQVYAKTGGYKGQVVALRMYEKKNLYINRKMKKEMKLMRDLRHSNINPFLGACIDPPVFIIVTEYCPKGSLLDILENEDLQLDNMFVASLVNDIIQGMIFLHDSELQYHGNLKSSNCVVNSRWTLQLTDFGLLEVRAATYKIEDEHAFFRNLFWKAPECIKTLVVEGSQKADVYAFGIILHEIFGRAGPYGFYAMSPKEIIDRVRNDGKTNPFRPDVRPLQCGAYIKQCMQACWSENPDERPDFRIIRKTLRPLNNGMKRNIFDNMVAMMEKYQKNLEDIVEERTTQLNEEKKKTEALLLRMLPRCVADQLKIGEAVVPESYSCVTIYFSDICGFTQLSADSTPMEVVDMLNDLYTIFDNTIRTFDVYKIETIGDAYMVVSGLPIRNGDNHAGEIASMSLQLLREIKSFRVRHRPDYIISLRIGMHSGPCVAGVVGLTMPRYTLFGDTVNTASRMETNGEPMKIHCSQQSKDILDKLGGYVTEPRGKVFMKGKGELFTYWLVNEDVYIRYSRVQNAPVVLELFKSTYFQPSATKALQKLNIIKVSSQNAHVRNLSRGSDDSDVHKSNILDLLRESSENKHLRCESPNSRLISTPLHTPKVFTCPTVNGLSSVCANVNRFSNEISSERVCKAASFSDFTMSKHHIAQGSEDDSDNETNSLLIRHYSVSQRTSQQDGIEQIHVFGTHVNGQNIVNADQTNETETSEFTVV